LSRVASVEKQAEFIAQYEDLMNTLRADEAAYFADAVDPEYQTKPSFVWVKAGLLSRNHPQRMEKVPRQGLRQLPRHKPREFSAFGVAAV